MSAAHAVQARPVIGFVEWFVYVGVGLVKTPVTIFKACCCSNKLARDDKVIQKFQKKFPKFSLKELGALHEQVCVHYGMS